MTLLLNDHGRDVKRVVVWLDDEMFLPFSILGQSLAGGTGAPKATLLGLIQRVTPYLLVLSDDRDTGDHDRGTGRVIDPTRANDRTEERLFLHVRVRPIIDAAERVFWIVDLLQKEPATGNERVRDLEHWLGAIATLPTNGCRHRALVLSKAYQRTVDPHQDVLTRFRNILNDPPYVQQGYTDTILRHIVEFLG